MTTAELWVQVFAQVAAGRAVDLSAGFEIRDRELYLQEMESLTLERSLELGFHNRASPGGHGMAV